MRGALGIPTLEHLSCVDKYLSVHACYMNAMSTVYQKSLGSFWRVYVQTNLGQHLLQLPQSSWSNITLTGLYNEAPWNFKNFGVHRKSLSIWSSIVNICGMTFISNLIQNCLWFYLPTLVLGQADHPLSSIISYFIIFHDFVHVY